MAILLVVLGVLALVHWLYEGVVAPSLRLSLKFDLFALRDEGRRLARNTDDRDVRVAAELLCETVDLAMLGLAHMSVPQLLKMSKRRLEDEQLEEDVQEEVRFIESIASPEIRSLIDRALRVIIKAALVNSAMLLFYLCPLIPFLLFFGPDKTQRGAEVYAFSDRSRPSFGHAPRLAWG